MNQKQSNLFDFATGLGVVITNIGDYQNKESILQCRCKNGHHLQASVDTLLKTGFECLECLAEFQSNITDTTPYFLSLDAATYTTGMSIFNKEGQLLGHKTFNVDKKKDYFVRLKEIVEEVYNIVVKQNIKCVILEDIQYQQNPVLFIYGSKRPEQKLAAIERAYKVFKTEIPEDESESIFLGMYGVNQYYKNRTYKEE